MIIYLIMDEEKKVKLDMRWSVGVKYNRFGIFVFSAYSPLIHSFG